MQHVGFGRLVRFGLLAGLAGGLAEVAWISLYAAASGADAASVARGVTDTFGLVVAAPASAGIALHMGIAAALGVVVAFALRPLRGHCSALGFDATIISVLGLVWAVNFFVVLPMVNPGFVALVPLTVSFVSKLLFGGAAALSLRIAEAATSHARRA